MLNKILKIFSLIKIIISWKILGDEYLCNKLPALQKGVNRIILKRSFATIGENVDIECFIKLHNANSSTKNLIIGSKCHIGKECFFDLKDKIIIENNVTISMQNTFLTHLDVGAVSLVKKFPLSSDKIIIRKNCYIGARSTILMGVELGEGCFVCAGSLVKDSFPANSFIAGIPASKIKTI